ncbi:MAG: Fic family protein [Planctomycetota bacterium]
MKLARVALLRELPLKDDRGCPFSYWVPDSALEELHKIDMELGGHLGSPSQAVNSADRDRYMIRSIMEEAIASSQIEGAATTRRIAKEMLKTGRPPRDKSEHMILNNYRTIRWLREHKDEPLTRDLLLGIQGRMTASTLDDADAAGRFRLPSEKIAVFDDRDGEVTHTPPPAEELEERLILLYDFANAEETAGEFMHPVVRAMILHFWVAYDHPFVDGNGRTARALFYWYMLRKGYWLFEFLSISQFIIGAPVQYQRAFLNTETDEGDVTYFLMYHLQAIRRAREELYHYLDQQQKRNAELLRLLKFRPGMNHRQDALLAHAIRHDGATYTIQSHEGSQGVSYQTARTDLADLAKRGLLIEHKIGRRFHYTAPPDLRERLGVGQ